MTTEPHTLWDRLAGEVARRLGLHFPAERLADLHRGASSAASELGLADAAALARRVLHAEGDSDAMDALACHLTIGETYFFRGTETFEVLRSRLLPALIRQRGQKRLRIWSAGCCTGEEAYSLAMLVHELLPGLSGWDLRILGTDINPRYLARAAEGVYGEWSFRGVPAHVRQRHFERTRKNQYRIRPEIRALVSFAPLNLVEDGARCHALETQDLVFCRNVLMYFTTAQARRAIHTLRRAMAADGWLVVAPCEASRQLFGEFTTVCADGAILYTPLSGPELAQAWPALAPMAAPVPQAGSDTRRLQAIAAPPSARKQMSVRRPPALAMPGGPTRSAATTARAGVAAAAAKAQALADCGAPGALAACEAWIAMDKLDAGAHHLHALILLEQGDTTAARSALQRALYLEPERAMAHFAFGQLERSVGRHASAVRHLLSARELLLRYPAGKTVPNGDGMDAVQLLAVVDAALASRESA